MEYGEKFDIDLLKDNMENEQKEILKIKFRFFRYNIYRW